jgi:hypothetical protein
MRTGKLIYKCCKCGAIEEGTQIPDTNIQMMMSYDGRKMLCVDGSPLEMNQVHICSDGDIGITVLIGVKVGKE